jgi:hypothetical protein
VRAPTRWNRARRAVAAALVVAFAVLLPAAITSAWIRGTILSTSGYVAAVTPIAASPVVHAAVQDAVTSRIDAALSRAGTSKASPARVLAGPLGTWLAGLAGEGVSRFMASQAFQRLWADANRFAHSQLIGVLNGDSTVVKATGGEVALNLRTRIPLFSVAALAGPRHGYRILVAITSLVLILTPLALVGALAASPHRRRTLIQMSNGGTLTVLAVMIAMSWGQSSLIDRATPRYQAVTSVIVHALTNGFFVMSTWCVVGGLAVTTIALLSGHAAGPSGWIADQEPSRSLRLH